MTGTASSISELLSDTVSPDTGAELIASKVKAMVWGRPDHSRNRECRNTILRRAIISRNVAVFVPVIWA